MGKYQNESMIYSILRLQKGEIILAFLVSANIKESLEGKKAKNLLLLNSEKKNCSDYFHMALKRGIILLYLTKTMDI